MKIIDFVYYFPNVREKGFNFSKKKNWRNCRLVGHECERIFFLLVPSHDRDLHMIFCFEILLKLTRAPLKKMNFKVKRKIRYQYKSSALRLLINTTVKARDNFA